MDEIKPISEMIIKYLPCFSNHFRSTIFGAGEWARDNRDARDIEDNSIIFFALFSAKKMVELFPRLFYDGSMDKIWYIYVAGQQEGPYSVEDLKKDKRLTLETFVWREGFSGWKKIQDVPELKAVFKANETPHNPDETETETEKENERLRLAKAALADEELALDMRGLPPPYIFWIILFVILLVYVVSLINS